MKMRYLTREPIDRHRFIEESDDACLPEGTAGNAPAGGSHKSGADILFLGRVRDHSNGKKVLHLEYESFEEMADRMMGALISTARSKFEVDEVRVLHRLGRVGLGEIAVAISVRSAHRDEAYQASRHVIEVIKHRVPIWKKEFFSDGTNEWGSCAPGHPEEPFDRDPEMTVRRQAL